MKNSDIQDISAPKHVSKKDLDYNVSMGLQRRTNKKFSSKCTTLCRSNVLVVDDEPFNCIAVQGICRMFGFESVACHDGMEAMSIFQKKYNNECCLNKFDIIFTDLQMPKMDGFRLTQGIRSVERVFQDKLQKKSASQQYKTL